MQKFGDNHGHKIIYRDEFQIKKLILRMICWIFLSFIILRMMDALATTRIVLTGAAMGGSTKHPTPRLPISHHQVRIITKSYHIKNLIYHVQLFWMKTSHLYTLSFGWFVLDHFHKVLIVKFSRTLNRNYQSFFILHTSIVRTNL